MNSAQGAAYRSWYTGIPQTAPSWSRCLSMPTSTLKAKMRMTKYALMNIQARSNNRDGMALRIIADRLLKVPQQTKLIISISDGQPKAMPDYTGDKAAKDMKATLQEYRRQDIRFLAAAIGQDKESIRELYGAENMLDITDLKQLPARLIQVIARYL